MTRSNQIRVWLDAELNRHRFCGGDVPTGCLRVSSFTVTGATLHDPHVSDALQAFDRALHTMFPGRSDDEDGGVSIQLAMKPELPRHGFRVSGSPTDVLIEAASERGITQALHYLRREMADRRGPWLPLGEIVRFPSLQTALTEGVFVPADQRCDDLGNFSDAELELMAHFGATGMKVVLDLSKLWRSPTLPELNAPDVEQKFRQLEAHAARLGRFGLDLFLLLNMPSLPASHPVLATHPEVSGAEEEVFLEELSGRRNRVLCSSEPRVQTAYGDVVENLVRAVPSSAGVIMLVGGEGYRHCFTRPSQTDSRGTNCARCAAVGPHACVAQLANVIGSAIKRASRSQRLLVWPYSAFVWSKDDPGESRWIGQLDEGIEVLSNFDCGDLDPHGNGQVSLFDYNIRIPGPSQRFQAQAAECGRTSRPILARTETTTTPDTPFVPFLPLPFLWFERFRAIREAGAAGFMGQWRFYGMNGSLPEELQYHSIWNPERTAEQILHTAARRDYGISELAADQVVEGWRQLGEAWSFFPYSAMTSGERDAYFRGPWYLGPAHPLVFNPLDIYALGPEFFRRRGDLAEALSVEEIALLPGAPRYSSDLLFCLPYGADAYSSRLGECRQQWSAALAALELAVGPTPTDRANLDLNVVRILGCHLNSLGNVCAFFQQRDALGSAAQDSESLDGVFDSLAAIIDREVANAQVALGLVRADPRLGFGHTYGEAYDAEMIEQKIRQCEFLRQNELPRIRSVIRFHVWYRFP